MLLFVSFKCTLLLKLWKSAGLVCCSVFMSFALCCSVLVQSHRVLTWLDLPSEWIVAQLLTNSPHSPLKKHHVTTSCVQSVGGGSREGLCWVNRMGVGGKAGVVALYCLTDSGTARGNGWSWPGDNTGEHAASQLSPLCVAGWETPYK